MNKFLSKMMPDDDAPEHIEFHETARKGTVTISQEFATKRGLAHRQKQIRAVCQNCNNGWMSLVEAATKPHLIPLMQGTPTILDWYARQMLVDWIVLKLLVAEFNASQQSPPDPIFSGRDREYFHGWRVIPEGLRIWIAKHSSHIKWKSGILRHSGGLAPLGTTLPPPPRSSNVQSVSFGIGHLLIHATATNFAPSYPILDTLNGDSPRYRLLWPIGGHDIRWPPIVTISQSDADWIADDLQRLITSPTTVHTN